MCLLLDTGICLIVESRDSRAVDILAPARRADIHPGSIAA